MGDGLNEILNKFRQLDPNIDKEIDALDLLPFSKNVLMNPDNTRSTAAFKASFGATAPRTKKKPRTGTVVHRGANGIVSTMHIH